MRILYLDCSMGAAGDMLTAALLELMDDPDAAVARLNALGLPGVRYENQPSVKCGITGTHMHVTVNGEAEGEHEHHHDHDHEHHHDHDHDYEHHHDHDHDHDHEHEHHHEHHHHHASMQDVTDIVAGLKLPEKVRADVLAVYRLIAEAESHAHGVPVTQIHFHEVGTMDAIADVAAVCLLMNELAPERVIASPVHVGSGTVHCAHGILPVPAPATAYILRGVPVYGGSIRGELCTPTGAALLRHFVSSFGAMPAMTTEKLGYGMGRKDFEAANCVRAALGESFDQGLSDTICELSFNVDDMTAEDIGFALDRFFEAGALDAFTTPIGMKKCRPGTLITVFCRPADKESMIGEIFRHTTTIGLRERETARRVLARECEVRRTTLGDVRMKTVSGYGTERSKPEYSDLAAIALEKGMSLREVREVIAAEADE